MTLAIYSADSIQLRCRGTSQQAQIQLSAIKSCNCSELKYGGYTGRGWEAVFDSRFALVKPSLQMAANRCKRHTISANNFSYAVEVFNPPIGKRHPEKVFSQEHLL
jgi:hypothetical protein